MLDYSLNGVWGSGGSRMNTLAQVFFLPALLRDANIRKAQKEHLIHLPRKYVSSQSEDSN